MSERRVCVVTGGANGIGLAIASLFRDSDWRVVIADLDEDGLGELTSAFPSSDGHTLIRCDVTSDNEVGRLGNRVTTQYGRLDALINNAGVTNPAPLHRISWSSWMEMLDLHLGGSVRTSVAMLPLLAARDDASIVMISSIAAARGLSGRAHYGVSKAGLEALVRACAVEWAPLGIRVNAVAPGFILTENAKRLYEQGIGNREAREDSVPLGRFGAPAEIADPVVWLCAAASYVTGQVVVVDGGYLIDADIGRDSTSLSPSELRAELTEGGSLRVAKPSWDR